MPTCHMDLTSYFWMGLSLQAGAGQCWTDQSNPQLAISAAIGSVATRAKSIKMARPSRAMTPPRPPDTPMRPARCAPRLPREALGSLATPHMRGARMGTHGKPYTHSVDPPSAHGAARLPRNDSTAATDNALNTPPEASSVRPPPTQRGSGVPYHAPYAWGTHGLP